MSLKRTKYDNATTRVVLVLPISIKYDPNRHFIRTYVMGCDDKHTPGLLKVLLHAKYFTTTCV